MALFSNVEKPRDLSFTLRPVFVLENAISALSNPGFSPVQVGLIEASEDGFEITVPSYDERTGNEAFAYLVLKSSALEDFMCRKSMRKVFNWKEISEFFKDSEEIEAESVTVFILENSNQLSFQLGSTQDDFDPGLPLTIDLQDDKAPLLDFPNVSYVYENVFPSKVLRSMFIKLQNKASTQPGTVKVTLEPATIEVNMNGVPWGSLDKFAEEQEGEQTITMQCQHWKALESATWTGNKCSVCLVTEPNDFIMLRFHLEELGDFVFLNQAQFETNPDKFTVLGQFCRLN